LAKPKEFIVFARPSSK